MKIWSLFGFALIGFAATIGQILVLRELLTIFSGSELAVAIVLAAWLFWTALGSLLAARMSAPPAEGQRWFAYLQSASGLVLLGTVFLIRRARPLFRVRVGELVTLAQMLAISFLTLAPFCLISGFLFTLACSVLAAQISAWKRSPGLVYFLEGLGAGIGGLLFTLLLIHFLNPVQVTGAVAFLLWLSGLAIRLQAGRISWPALSAFFVVFLLLAAVQYAASALELASRQWQWRGFHLIDSRETVYGHIAVVQKDSQLSFFENGLWNFTVPDILSAEEAVHYAMLEHPRPRSVLLIGGGISGSLAQLLKHPGVSLVDYVELDPELIRLGESHLPRQVSAALHDPRVRVYHEDGRRYLSRTSNTYDVVLVNLPEPFTAQINRFYTREFFRLAASKMHKGAILSFRASAAEAVLGPTQANYLRLLYRTAASVFPQVLVFPGQTARFFCSTSAGVLNPNPEILVQRLRQRHLQLLYVRDYYILFNLSRLRQQSFMAMIDQAGETRVNSDLNPLGYFYNLLLWGTQYSHRMGRAFGALSRRSLWAGFAMLCLAVGTLSLGYRSGPVAARAPKLRLFYAVSLFGLTEISLEILVVFAFQVFFGYVYYQIGLLLTLFMIGLALGSIILSYYPKKRGVEIRDLALFQAILACFCLVLALVIFYFHRRPAAGPAGLLYRQSFSAVSLAAGILGGTHFPLTNRLLLKREAAVAGTAGVVYAVDLLGSFLGALLVGLVFIPLAGILQTLLMLALLNLTAVVSLISSRTTPAPAPRNF